MTDTLTTLAYQWQWFKPTMTHAEVKKLRKHLARQYHPDIAKDGGARMTAINAELERWEQLYGHDAPPIVKLPPGAEHWTPDQWWANIKNAAQQRNAHVAQNPPPVQPQPAPQPAAPSPSPPVQPQPHPARSSSASTTRQPRTNAWIDTDFWNAFQSSLADLQSSFGLAEMLWWRDRLAGREDGEVFQPQVDPDPIRERVSFRDGHLTLDRHIVLPGVGFRYRTVFGRSRERTMEDDRYPADLWQVQRIINQLEALRIANCLVIMLPFEVGILGSTGKEVRIGAIQILQRLLQDLTIGFLMNGCFQCGSTCLDRRVVLCYNIPTPAV